MNYSVESKDYSLDGALRVYFDHEVRKVKGGDLEDYDLFLYKIKNRSKFLHQEHPVDISPETFTYKNYWTDFAKKSVEGMWVDDEGTAVYMPPKLFYYTNYVKILGNLTSGEDGAVTRSRMSPNLSSLEWIQFSYIICADGFSGFKDDDEFTCNLLVKKLHQGVVLSKYEQRGLANNCFNEKGNLKVFVDPWEYLTRFYLVDNPRGELGRALYENPVTDILVSGSRDVSKSYTAYGGDFMHEWTFGGIKSIDGKDAASTKRLFSMVSGTKNPLNRSAGIIKGFYDSQPGKFEFADEDQPDVMGAFYKKSYGTWENGNTVEHTIKTKQYTEALSGSSLQISVVTPDRKRVGAGDRFVRMYIEEAGLIEYITDIHGTNRDSMISDGEVKIGSAYITGTAGDLKAIEGMKKLILNPVGYTIFAIPNYWRDAERNSIALFLSAMYRFRGRQDSNGNNDLQDALEKLHNDRVKNAETMDSTAFDDYVLNSPISPNEMLRPNRRSFLPVKEAQDRLADIEDYKYLEARHTTGKLFWDASEKYGVGFNRDDSLHPIMGYNIDRSKIDLAGAFSFFEHPPSYIPDGLFWVIFDPVGKPGPGATLDASLNCAIVYKYFYTGNENTMEDCIVAEWIGRDNDIDDSYEKVVKLAKYYNARIFPETNTPGFIDYCKRNDYFHMLQEEAYIAEREINPNYRKRGAVGFSIYGPKKKPWLLQRTKKWLTRKRGYNQDTGEFHSRTIDHILSTRCLEEITAFDYTKGNYDYISCLLGLSLLLAQLEEEPIEIKEKEPEPERFEVTYTTVPSKRRRSTFETW